MYFCCSWFSNMVSFRYVLVVLNSLHDIFSLRSFHDIFYNFLIHEKHYAMNVGHWSKSISWKYFIFHEMTLKMYFTKCPERKISVHPSLKELFDKQCPLVQYIKVETHDFNFYLNILSKILFTRQPEIIYDRITCSFNISLSYPRIRPLSSFSPFFWMFLAQQQIPSSNYEKSHQFVVIYFRHFLKITALFK